MECKKINKQTQQKQTPGYREQTDGQMGGELVGKVRGLRGTNWQLQNQYGNVKHSMGNIVNSIVITMCGARWLLDLWGHHFVRYINV